MAEFLPGRLAKWLSEHPNVTIELEERTSTDIINSIHNGIAEAGLVSDAVDPRELMLEPIADDRLALIVPTTHPFGFRHEVSLSQKRSTRLLLGFTPAARCRSTSTDMPENWVTH